MCQITVRANVDVHGDLVAGLPWGAQQRTSTVDGTAHGGSAEDNERVRRVQEGVRLQKHVSRNHAVEQHAGPEMLSTNVLHIICCYILTAGNGCLFGGNDVKLLDKQH